MSDSGKLRKTKGNLRLVLSFFIGFTRVACNKFMKIENIVKQGE